MKFWSNFEKPTCYVFKRKGTPSFYNIVNYWESFFLLYYVAIKCQLLKYRLVAEISLQLYKLCLLYIYFFDRIIYLETII